GKSRRSLGPQYSKMRRRTAPLRLRLRHRAFMHHHPVNPETITNLSESRSKESLLHRHEHLASVGKCRKDALGLAVARCVQRQIRTSHWLRFRDVGASKFSASNGYTRMEDGVLPFAGRIGAGGRILPLRHHHADLRSEMLLI